MCGLVGVIGPLTKNYQNWMAQALVVNSLRGEDSTGIFTVTEKKEVAVHKEALDGSWFVKSKETRALLSASPIVTIGHNRAATKGAVAQGNAHPFQVGSITLVHNGTLHAVPNEKDYAVDSHALAANIAAKGREGLEEAHGAYSIIMYNSNTGLLSLARNKERPLFWAATKEGNILLASELGMLLWLADRNGIEVTKYASTAADVWYDIDPEQRGTCVETKIVHKPIVYTNTKREPWANKGHKNSIERGVPLTSVLLNSLGLSSTELIRWCKWNAVGAERGGTGTMIGHTTKAPYYEVVVDFCTWEFAAKFINSVTQATLRSVKNYTSDDPTLVCYQLDLVAKKEEPRKALPFVKKDKGQSVYKNADGENLSLKAWKRLVHQGCALCSRQFTRKDAKTMAFLKQDKSPMCEECALPWKDEVIYAHQTV